MLGTCHRHLKELVKSLLRNLRKVVNSIRRLLVMQFQARPAEKTAHTRCVLAITTAMRDPDPLVRKGALSALKCAAKENHALLSVNVEKYASTLVNCLYDQETVLKLAAERCARHVFHIIEGSKAVNVSKFVTVTPEAAMRISNHPEDGDESDDDEITEGFKNELEKVTVDDGPKLSFHGAGQHFVKVDESEKCSKLKDLLGLLDFSHFVIFVESDRKAGELDLLLLEWNFPSMCLPSRLSEESRSTLYNGFREAPKAILVTHQLVESRGLVINFDLPDSCDAYMLRVGVSGVFGPQSPAISLVELGSEFDVLFKQVEEKYEVEITELPVSSKVTGETSCG